MRTEDEVTKVRNEGGWIRLERLSRIRVTGPQRVKFLHGLLSNDIAGLLPGHSRLAALMNLKGQQVAWMRVLAQPEALICEVPLAVRDTMVETFLHYKVGAPVRFEKLDGVVFGLFGPKAPEMLRGLGVTEVPSETETFTTTQLPTRALVCSREQDMPAAGFTLHVETEDAEKVEGQLFASFGEPISAAALETLRTEEGIAWHGIDVTEENLLHETEKLAVYHSASKGCYLGQEVVARLEGRGGNVNKRFRGFRGPKLVAKGDEIVADGKPVGRVTSAGISPAFGPIAMGYVHRSHAEPGTRVLIGDAEFEISLLPFKV